VACRSRSQPGGEPRLPGFAEARRGRNQRSIADSSERVGQPSLLVINDRRDQCISHSGKDGEAGSKRAVECCPGVGERLTWRHKSTLISTSSLGAWFSTRALTRQTRAQNAATQTDASGENFAVNDL